MLCDIWPPFDDRHAGRSGRLIVAAERAIHGGMRRRVMRESSYGQGLSRRSAYWDWAHGVDENAGRGAFLLLDVTGWLTEKRV